MTYKTLKWSNKNKNQLFISYMTKKGHIRL